ncbi:MAG: efflux RND transporter periplasmic adaptor subunit [Prevotellaceae bacterium]|jgi:RND family efflux transporter MFP subunit|nr:efflux RND transporter periplasmic adaptor subunit [Prevotellaceae bacterium]
MKTRQLLGICALATVLLFTACGSKKKQESVQEKQSKTKIQVVKAEARNVDQLGSFTATVEAEITNNIAPQTAGRIKKTYVEVGDYVQKGQILAEMDANNLNQAKLKMENDKTEFDRVDELHKVGGISKSTWDARKLSYALSKESYENLLENTYLRSPISGIVTRRFYDSGDMFTMSSPIYVVEQIQPVKLLVHVSEVLFTKVKKEMEVDISLDVYENEQFKGQVSLVYPTIDPETRTFPVEVKIRSAVSKVRPGMFARVTFNYGTERRVVVPDVSIQKMSGSAERYVYVCDNDVVTYRKVNIGRRLDNEYEILSGLNEGEMIATTGHSRLTNGSKVEIVN